MACMVFLILLTATSVLVNIWELVRVSRLEQRLSQKAKRTDPKPLDLDQEI